MNRYHYQFTTVQTRQVLLFYLLLTLRYLLVAGPAFLVFYVLFRQKWGLLRVQRPFPRRADYCREIGYSFLTFVLFSFIGLVLVSEGAIILVQKAGLPGRAARRPRHSTGGHRGLNRVLTKVVYFQDAKMPSRCSGRAFLFALD